MKSHLLQLVGNSENVLRGISLAREYLQARVLQSFQEDGVFSRWAFLGGTALRFLYSMLTCNTENQVLKESHERLPMTSGGACQLVAQKWD